MSKKPFDQEISAAGLAKSRVSAIKPLITDIVNFTGVIGRLRLRTYQRQVAEAVIHSVVQNAGRSIVVMFPRQSGKNELQAQIEAYLLLLLHESHAEMVKVSPTWKPQSQNAMRRLERVLNRNLLTRGQWHKESGYIYRLGNSRILFLSGAPEANIVGATASLLLEVDEAQDVRIDKFDRDIAPMASSTNATRVFWGTAWTSRTLLARELRAARAAEQTDGIRRAFVINADDVAAEVPAYGRFVAEQTARLGRNHPLIRTQYYAEEIDAEVSLFTPVRRALMQGSHPAQERPTPGALYAVMIDVAGEDEGATFGGNGIACGNAAGSASNDTAILHNPGRDLTALTVVEIITETLDDPLLRAPAYHTVCRRQWQGIKHALLYGQLRALIEHWNARRVVVDATGVGAGLASFLAQAFGDRIQPFLFTSASKSQLGWDFLAVCDTGRWKESLGGAPASGNPALQEQFWQQCEFCESQVLDGPGKLMRWGVPDGKRHPSTGELLHDDLLISAALCAVLDHHHWARASASVILPARDVLDELDEGF